MWLVVTHVIVLEDQTDLTNDMKRSSDRVKRSSTECSSASLSSTSSSSSSASLVAAEMAVPQVTLSTAATLWQWLANSEVGRDPATIVLEYIEYSMKIAQMWKQAGGRCVLALLSLPTGEIASCHSRSGKKVCICIWKEGVLVRELEGHSDEVNCFALLPAGDIASGSDDMIVKIWRNGECIQTLEQASHVYGLCVLGNGDLVCGLWNGGIKVWRDGQCLFTLKGHSLIVNCLLLLPDGVEFASGSHDMTIRIWRDGVCRQVLRGHKDFIRCLARLPCGDLLSGSRDATIKIWRNGSCVQTLREHSDWVTALLALSNGDWLSGSRDKTVKIWNSNGVCLRTIEMGSGAWCLTLVDALHVVVGLENGEMKAILL